jgi:hypothetical protein
MTRLGGRSWMDITLYFKLSPDIYYVPVKGSERSALWKAMVTTKIKQEGLGQDRSVKSEIINLVNLRFISEYITSLRRK